MEDYGTKRKGVYFSFTQDIADKLNECVRLKNLKLAKHSTSTTKQDYVADLIRNDYNRLRGETLDADANDRVNQKIESEVDTKFANLSEVTNEIYRQLMVTQKLLDFFIQKTVNDFDDVVKDKGIMKDSDEYNQTMSDYKKHLETILNRNSDGFKAVCEWFYRQENPTNNYDDEDEYDGV